MCHTNLTYCIKIREIDVHIFFLIISKYFFQATREKIASSLIMEKWLTNIDKCRRNFAKGGNGDHTSLGIEYT